MRFVPNAVSMGLARQILLTQKNSPKLLLGAGVVGMIGSTVLACRATLKVEDILEKTQGDLRAAKAMEHPEYTSGDRKKDIAIIYTRSTVSFVKLYGPSVLLGAASIACLTKSHSILAERNAALTAAYVAVDEAFKRYRERVVNRYGTEVDRELRYSNEEVDLISDSGKVSTETRVDPNEHSMYARFFDQMSPEWTKDPEYNFVFLRGHQQYFNDQLKVRGHVFLNEVYDELGIPRTKPGAVVGWVLSPNSDNYISFGMFDSDNPKARDFVNGREGAILLDFNVDGIIFDRIENTEPPQWQK